MSKRVVLIGGTGVLGRRLLQMFTESAHMVKVVTSSAHLALFTGDYSRISVEENNLKSVHEITQIITGSDIVINLVGAIYETSDRTFVESHINIPERIAMAVASIPKRCRPMLIHFSALGADEGSRSLYFKTKALGENAVHKIVPDATVIQPGLILSQEMPLFRTFLKIAKMFHIVPVIIPDYPNIFYPIHIDDVVLAVRNLTISPSSANQKNKLCRLCSSQGYSFGQLTKLMLDHTKISYCRLFIPRPFAYMMAFVLQTRLASFFLKPFTGSVDPILTVDQLKMLAINMEKTAAEADRDTLSLGIKPVPATCVFSLWS